MIIRNIVSIRLLDIVQFYSGGLQKVGLKQISVRAVVLVAMSPKMYRHSWQSGCLTR